MRRYYEFAVIVVLVSILALLLMWALERARGEMEETIVQSEVAALRIGLIEVVAHRETFGGELPKSSNPVAWVATPPANYVGERDGRPDDKSVWYFDRRSKELVFLFHDGRQARFRLSRDGAESSQRVVVAGVGLLRLEDRRE